MSGHEHEHAQGMVHKCQRCYALEIEKPLMVCSQCKCTKYCSRECQKADWKSHKRQCKNNADLERGLKANQNTPIGILHSLLLPDNLSLYELDQLLEAWVRVHTRTLMLACLHAIRLPDDYDRINTHVLVLHLRPLPRSVHGGDPARAFAVTDAYALDAEEGARRDDPWRQSIEYLRTSQRRAEKLGAGRAGATLIECPPLAVQTVPFGSVQPVHGRVQENWKDVLTEDIREGRRVSALSPL